MNMKNKKRCFMSSFHAVSGFTLIELLVAAALSMIVLIAAGSGFAVTQRLSSVANARLQVQQDLRNASNMIVRDARMAGFFGCFNLAKQSLADEKVVINDYGNYRNTTYTSHENLDDLIFKNQQNQGVKVFSAAEIGNKLGRGFAVAANTDVLLFTYGVGSGNADVSGTAFNVATADNDELAELSGQQNAPLITSTCSSLERFGQSGKSYNSGKLAITGLSNTALNKKNATVFRQAVNVYAIGTPAGGTKGLYLFQLNADGTMGDPQLLLSRVDNWNISFGYYASADACSQGKDDAAITFEDEIRKGENAPSPVLLRIKLNGSGSNLDLKAGKASNNSTSDVQSYFITATVRAGALCANRNIQQDVSLKP